MPLTPADVHNVAFKKPPIGKRGYDEDEVDAFLDEVEREFARLIEENNDLRGQLGGQVARRPIAEAEPGEAAGESAEAVTDAAAEPGPLGPSEGEQRLARENAELTERLKDLETRLRESQEAVSKDSEQALSVLMTAQRTANEHVSDARREADKMLADARAKADELTRAAAASAEALENDARDKHQQAMGGLELQSQTLEKHIEGLKAFEREYRSRLKAYLEGQLRDLDGKAAALDGAGGAAAGPSDPQSTGARS